MISKLRFTIALLLYSSVLSAQDETPTKRLSPLIFSLGTRNTISVFSGDKQTKPGTGIGGQFRVQFTDKMNSEWFADYISSSISDFAVRNDYHIGWSLMFYPGKNKGFENFFKPYILAGHCFDYTEIKERENPSNAQHRWSLAMQAGAGTHLNITPRFDFSLSGQYMLHFGKDIEAFQKEGNVVIQKNISSSPDGHLLLTVSINYKINVQNTKGKV